MPEEIEIETRELQETIDELQEERKERVEEEHKNAWTRYIAMSTALMAVFAAMGAMLSGGKVNEAMIDQIRASDKWNEYQSARQKDHLYTIKANELLDTGAKFAEKPSEKPLIEPIEPKSNHSVAVEKPTIAKPEKKSRFARAANAR